jgi:hypothetical protein
MPADFRRFPDLPGAWRDHRGRAQIRIYAFFVLFVAYAGIAGAHLPPRDRDRAALLSVTAGGDTLRVTVRPARGPGSIVEARRTGPSGFSTARKYLAFPIYRAELADIDGDGGADLLLGVIKTTRHDAHARRRVHVYTLDGGALRPLWLGSRVAMPLRDFLVTMRDGVPLLATLVRERDGRSAIGLWKWTTFGPRFIAWEARALSRPAALRAFRALANNRELP